MSHLPDDFDIRATYTRRNKDAAKCELCEAQFTKKIAALNVFKDKNPVRYCKRCARACCEVCSDNKRQLSKNNPEIVRVCDQCDYEMENIKLKQRLKQVKENTFAFIERQSRQTQDVTENSEELK